MKFTISANEIGHIAISMAVVALAFSINDLQVSKEQFLMAFPITLIAVGTGFVFHELAHKFVAMHYGAYARYQASESGLAFALILSLVTQGRFVFAAPGAVYIYSQHLTKMQNGIISLAGPLTNLLIGSFALMLFMFTPASYLSPIFGAVASINFFLGFFNMLPVPPLDGSKVLAWNPLIWLALIAVLAIPIIPSFLG